MSSTSTASLEGLPATAAPVGHANHRQLWQTLAARGAFLVLLTLAWEIMARVSGHPLLPGVSEVYGEVVRILEGGLFLPQMAMTISRVWWGFLLAFTLSLAAGVALHRSPVGLAFVEPGVLIGLTVPGLVWALLCVIWFGVSAIGPVIGVALGVAPALFLNIVQGLKSVNPDLVEMSRVLGFTARERVTKLWLPTLVPFLLSGARLGLSLAWKVIVLVEVFGMSSGVGYQLNNEFSSQNVAGVLAWTLCFALVMAILEYGLIAGLERRLTRWRRSAYV